MINQRLLPITLGIFLSTIGLGYSQNSKEKSASTDTETKEAKSSKDDGAEAGKKSAGSQSDVASKTATFEKIGKDSESYTNAVEAHDLDKAKEHVDKKSALRGTVTKIFEPRGNNMAIVNFDAKYQTALTAVVRKADFSKFPDLKKLVGKPVVISGKFIDYQGRPEIVLTSPEQIKLVE